MFTRLRAAATEHAYLGRRRRRQRVGHRDAVVGGADLSASSRGKDKLERDVWLIHLTGEEFPSDCMGARAFCQSLVEKTLRARVVGDDRWIDLSKTKVVGALVMDMIAHNRDHAHNIFQISPGRSARR